MATYSEFPSTYILLVLKTYEDAIFSIEINVRCLHRAFCSLICCSSAWQKISVHVIMALLL
jgi:hypothetical protein